MGKEDVVHIYSGILLNHKKDEIMSFVTTWMYLEIIILSKVSQKEKDKCHTIPLCCEIYNRAQMNQYTKQQQAHREQTCGCQRGGGCGREGPGVWN